MIHELSVDVEDYHNLLAREWLDVDGPPTHAVVDNTHRLLELFSRHNARATFFVLGEVAESYPELIREIARAGHEVGVHGHKHRLIFNLTPEAFRAELTTAKAIIEGAGGVEVQGHRAPAFSITPDTRWALEVLAGEGFRYDSSIFPFAGRRYGWPGFRRDIHEIELKGGRSIIEVPMSTVSIAGCSVPACGGGYLRHFPLRCTRWAMRRIQRERPAIVYLHPYEIELNATRPDTDRVNSGLARRVMRFHRFQLRNRKTVERKIVRLLEEFRFAPLSEVIHNVMG